MRGVVDRELKGQRAYERDVERRPFYHDGTARPTWYDLGPIAQWSWTRLGAAINGKHACTCDRKRAKKDQIDRLEMRVEMIEAICNALDMRPPLPDEKAAAYALMEQLSSPVKDAKAKP